MHRFSGSLGLNSLVLLFFAGTALALTRELTFFVIINAAFGLFFGISWLLSSRESMSAVIGKRSTKYGANAVVYSLLVIGIVIMANFLATRYNLRWDTSEAKVFSLASQSVQAVQGLEDDLEIIGFVEGGVNPTLRDLLDSYQHVSPQVSFRLVDPDRSPDLTERHKVTSYNAVHLEYGERSKLVTTPDEQSITNAILQITQSGQKTVCLVEGHGEAATDDLEEPRAYGVFKQSLENENYEVTPILLATLEEPPNDKCDLLITAGAQKLWLEPEIDLLRQYLQQGGHGLFLISATRSNQLSGVLAEFGVAVGDNIVVDQVVRLFQGPALGLDPIVEDYGAHPITADFAERTIFPLSRTIERADTVTEGIFVAELAMTSDSSWAESDLPGIFERSEATLDPGVDRKGPLSVAVAVEVAPSKEDAGSTRIVAFGSDQFINNKFINNFFNRDIILNAVGWTIGEENLISIRARTVRASRVQLTANQMTQIFYLSVLVLPELLLLMGIAVWTKRRNA